MKNIVVGIPKAFEYYRNQTLWEEFFNYLNITVVKSNNTTKKTLVDGGKYLIDEACLPLKIFIGHVIDLKDKCDYILVPRLECVKKKQKVCTNFMAAYDLCKNMFKNLNFINYDINLRKGKDEKSAFIKLGKELGIKPKLSKRAYLQAKKINEKKYELKRNTFNSKLNNQNIKILLVGHPYNLCDPYVSGSIVSYLEKENCTCLKSDIYNMNYNEEMANKISDKIYWTYNRELFSVVEQYKDEIDGIVLISTFPCGPDSLCNELITKHVKNKPLLSIIIDENESNIGLLTRLESFLDIIKTRKDCNNYEKR